MTFQTDIARFVTKIEHRQALIFFDVADALHNSIKEGDPTTGSPGQPVQESDLINSWQARHLEPFLFQTSPGMVYARGIEEGAREDASGQLRQLTLRSDVGGFHSVKITRIGFPKLVNAAASKVVV